jgi:hypothetical protein
VCIGVYEPELLIKKWQYNVGYFQVEYRNNKIITEPVISLRNLIQQFMTLKFKAWEYEEESRILSFRGAGYLRWRSSAVREVILGDQWFYRGANTSSEEAAKYRTSFIETILKLRKYQQNKRLTLYIALADPQAPLISRREITDQEITALLGAASRCSSNYEAIAYIEGRGPRPSVRASV